MEKVKILKSLFVKQTETLYQKGQEVEVSKEIAKRHAETGFMEILKPPGKSKPDLQKAEK